MNVTYRPDGILLQDLKSKEVDKINKLIDEMKAHDKRNETILPRPVIRYRNAITSDETIELKNIFCWTDWARLFSERIFFFLREPYLEGSVEHIAELITMCISYLNAIGYDEKGRSEIFRRVNEKNEKRGYFKKSD